MPRLPPIDKTWQHDVNVSLLGTGAHASDCRQLIRRVVAALLGFAQSPWICAGSSNGAVAALDGVDRWNVLPAAAVGAVNVVEAATLSDGESFTLSDGAATITFVFDVSGTYVPPGGYAGNRVRVLVSALSASGVRDACVAAINAAAIEVTAAIGGSDVVLLTNDSTTAGRDPNQSVTHSVAAPGFSVSGMSGGVNDLVFSSGIHSWIVLRQPEIAPNFSVCIDLNATAPASATLVVSWTALFSGGTVSARPTATATSAISVSWGPAASSFDTVLHATQSTDGQCTRFVWGCGPAGSGSQSTCRWIEFGVPKDPVAGWSSPAYAAWIAFTGAKPTETDLSTTAHFYGHSGGVTFVMSAGALRDKDDPSGALFSTKNALENAWDLRPISLVSFTPGRTGRHGRLFDLWFAHARGGADPESGHYFPSTSRDFMQFGECVLPWNGAALAGGDVDAAQDAIYLASVENYGQLGVSVGVDTPDVAGNVVDGSDVFQASGARNVNWQGREGRPAVDRATASRQVGALGADTARLSGDAAAARASGGEALLGSYAAPRAASSTGGRYTRTAANYHLIPQGTRLLIKFIRLGGG